MFISDLFEDTQRQVLVCYPGRFQLPHLGHKAVYNFLVKKFGANNTYVVTSDKVELPKSPFNFAEKSQLIGLTGIPKNRVVQSSQPYRAPELLSQFDTSNIVVIFAISEKDMAEDPRFKFGTKKDGSPTYFQPFVSIDKCRPASEHGYLLTTPTFQFDVLGKPVQSASEIRNMFINGDNKTRIKIFTDLYGKFDQSAFNLIASKLASITEGNVGNAALEFRTNDISAEEVLPYFKSKYKAYASSITTESYSPAHSIHLTTGVKKMINEQDEHREIKPFIDNMCRLGLSSAHKINVGDLLSVLHADVAFAWKEAFIYGFATPKEVTEIKTTNGEIDYIMFIDGDRYPRSTPATYEGKPVDYAMYFATGNDAKDALTVLSLSIPSGWELTIDPKLTQHVTESLHSFNKEDPFNSEFAPEAGMGRMTLRGWKQSLAKRLRELSNELDKSIEPGSIDYDLIWNHAATLLKPGSNIQQIANEIVLAHNELEKIRRKGGSNSRAFK